jgi:hypothetical protein
MVDQSTIGKTTGRAEGEPGGHRWQKDQKGMKEMKRNMGITIDLKDGKRIWAVLEDWTEDSLLVNVQGRQQNIGKFRIKKLHWNFITD